MFIYAFFCVSGGLGTGVILNLWLFIYICVYVCMWVGGWVGGCGGGLIDSKICVAAFHDVYNCKRDVCVCVSVCVCARACAWVRAFLCMGVLCACRARVCAVCIHTLGRTYTYIHLYVYLYVDVHMRVCPCARACLCVWVIRCVSCV